MRDLYFTPYVRYVEKCEKKESGEGGGNYDKVEKKSYHNGVNV